ncbi:hypothetical protein [Streptomyces sp. NPDC026659]|uniref:hypothetical protein n=1 Tax=Streptomyces sp. NPDC026659 TaxID=3155123 RepID=UPI0033DEB659
MGDHFQIIVDLDATEADAPGLAARVVDRLVGEGIVRAERTECLLGPGLGHPPGPRWDRAVAPADARWAPTDGLAVHTGRTFFHSGQGDPEWVRCPRCAATTRLYVYEDWTPVEGASDPFDRAIGLWRATGDADVECASCTARVPLPEWKWAYDSFAFGYLGFEFWNWPEFTDEFRDLVADALGGHRTAHPAGKF